jgi:O-antigen ligase
MLSGACWAVLSTLVLVKKKKHQFGILLLAGIVAFGQALTGGRMGYVTWGLLGLILCLLRWRKLLPIIPLGVVAVAILLPGVRERMLQGFASNDGPIVQEKDTAAMTSGRTLAWPYVVAKIKNSPIFGYGREAMVRIGITQQIKEDHGDGESFPHPHNAYLQLLLDNGLIGFFLVIPFYFVVVRQALSLFLDKQDPLCAAVGGVALSLLLALLIAAMGSQTFYPREGSVGMWAAMGVMWRLWVEREHSLDTGEPLFAEAEWMNELEMQTEEAMC